MTDWVIAVGVFTMMAIMVAAIAQQEFSWWVFPFSLLFLTIFAGILLLCFQNYREERFRRMAEVAYPHEPWMWNERWRSDRMISRSRSEFWGSLMFTIIFGVFALVGIGTLLSGLPEGNYWVLLNILPILGAGYFARKTYLARKTWNLEKHISLFTESCPAWIGATFSAVMTSTNGEQADQIEACLEHSKVNRHVSSDGVIFENVVDMKLPGHTESIGDGRIRISVDIPANSPATSWSEKKQKRWWDLVVVAGQSGEKVTLRYEVPVADPAMHQRPEV